MAESENDDLADALARMANADVASGEHMVNPQTQPDRADAPTPPPAQRIARPATARPAARPVMPEAVAPPKPPVPGGVVSGEMPGKSDRPATPGFSAPSVASALSSPARPITPALASGSATQKRHRPAAPTIQAGPAFSPTDLEADSGQSTGLTAQSISPDMMDNDDSAIAPAPEASLFLPKARSASSAQAREAIRRKQNLEYRRTLIPILLTTGSMLLIFGLLPFVSGEDSMLNNLPRWMPIGLLVIGAIMLVLAVINMLSVKQELATAAK